MNTTVLELGRRSYEEVWELQKRLVSLRASEAIPDVLLLLEHEHVITLGRKTTPENFRPQNISVFQVERGGDATYHGPGQLVGYPIIKLPDNDVLKYLRKLEETLIRAVTSYGIDGARKEGHTGVWVGKKKLASIGVAVAGWVTYHGFALNVNTDLNYFHLIKPCGLDPNVLTSMKEIAGHEFNMHEIERACAGQFSEVFGTELHYGDLDAILRQHPISPQKD